MTELILAAIVIVAMTHWITSWGRSTYPGNLVGEAALRSFHARRGGHAVEEWELEAEGELLTCSGWIKWERGGWEHVCEEGCPATVPPTVAQAKFV